MQNILIFITIFLGALFLVLFVWLYRIEQRLKIFWKGSKALSLEDLLHELTERLKKVEDNGKRLETNITTTNNRVKKSIRNIATVRFNPFPDAGSNQSFATALINDEGDGVIISTLYSRERMSIFAKPVVGGKPEYDLTEEEQTVLDTSKK